MEKTYPVLGHSMRFLLEPGDSAAAESCAPGALRAGEVALLVKWDGGRPAGYVIHRVLLNFTAGGRRLLLTKGDANLLPDFPPSAFQPVGRVTEVESGGRRFSAAPAKAWPLLSLYSFSANKLLSLSALAAAILFYCSRALLPRGAAALLNRLYLGWEEALYPALARAARLPALPAAASAAGGASATAALKTGRIRRNETWSGKITVADYLTIERGAAVTVLPGTKLSFERREPWFFPVLRAGSGGELRELESASAKILVYGGFSAVGSTGAAVTFSGSSFGGVHALGCGKISLKGCRLENSSACALSGRDQARLEVRDCGFINCRGGLEVSGRASVSALNCLVSDSAGPGLGVMDYAAASVSGGLVAACAGSGVEVSGRAFAGFSELKIESCAAGASMSGRAAVFLKRCGLNKNSGHGAQLAGAVLFSAADCGFSGNAAGILAQGFRTLTIEDTIFKENNGPGVSAEGSGELSLRRSRFYRNGSGAAFSGKGPVSFVSCLFEEQSGPAATLSGGGPAQFTGCSFTRNKAGLSFSGGCAGKVAACAFTGNGAPALEVYGRAGVSFSDSVSDGGPSALHLDGGSAVLSKVRISGTPFPGVVCVDWTRLRADQVSYEGRPWVKPVERRGPARRRRGVFLFAAGTAHLPVFSSLYKLFYLSALPAARLLLGVPGLRALYLYRGMAARGWVAGLSDMDLACVLEPAGAREDLALYSALRRRLRLLKAIFPFTGEVMLASAGEFASFLNCWGVKGAEFQASSRLLAGRPVELNPAPPAAGPADLTEAFYAYTLLTRHFLASGLPEAFTRRNCLKNLVDVKRYLAAPAPERGSRAAYARVLGLPLEGFMALDRGDAAYGAFLALHLAAGGEGGVVLGPVSAGGEGGWLNHAAFDAACRELSAAAGLDLGVVLDPLYRVYIVLPDSSAQDKAAYLRVCAALGRAPAGSPLAGASAVVLTQGAFALLCRLPYLNNPALGLDLGAGGSRTGLIPSDGGVYCSGLSYAGPAREAGQLRAMASLAARHFCASWRSLWTEMPPHYFYTRALGLRLLLEDGRALPFSRPELLRAAFEGKPGEVLPGWDAYCAGGAGAANYLFIAGQAAALGRLADAC